MPFPNALFVSVAHRLITDGSLMVVRTGAHNLEIDGSTCLVWSSIYALTLTDCTEIKTNTINMVFMALILKNIVEYRNFSKFIEIESIGRSVGEESLIEEESVLMVGQMCKCTAN